MEVRVPAPLLRLDGPHALGDLFSSGARVGITQPRLRGVARHTWASHPVSRCKWGTRGKTTPRFLLFGFVGNRGTHPGYELAVTIAKTIATPCVLSRGHPVPSPSLWQTLLRRRLRRPQSLRTRVRSPPVPTEAPVRANASRCDALTCNPLALRVV